MHRLALTALVPASNGDLLAHAQRYILEPWPVVSIRPLEKNVLGTLACLATFLEEGMWMDGSPVAPSYSIHPSPFSLVAPPLSISSAAYHPAIPPTSFSSCFLHFLSFATLSSSSPSSTSEHSTVRRRRLFQCRALRVCDFERAFPAGFLAGWISSLEREPGRTLGKVIASSREPPCQAQFPHETPDATTDLKDHSEPSRRRIFVDTLF